jgi:dTDP-4-dehydrorhamnose 3,5-epimerase
MPFDFTPSVIPEVLVIEPRIYTDKRGFFMETYKSSEFERCGLNRNFVQCNQSKSSQAVLRGLHYQLHPKPQCKLVWAASGEIYDVAVDLRRGSPTYGNWTGLQLSAENKKMLYVPVGFAHGFCVTSEEATIIYLTTEEYTANCEAGIIWNDPELAIDWPIVEPQLSTRDRNWPTLKFAQNSFYYNDIRENW